MFLFFGKTIRLGTQIDPDTQKEIHAALARERRPRLE